MPPLRPTDKQNKMPRPSDSEEESSQSPPPASRKKADKGKGKARATSDAEEDEDEDQEMEDATQANGAGGDKDDEEGEEDEGEYAGMSEKEKARAKEEKKQRKKKDLRMRYRALQGQVDDARGDLANTSVDALSAQVFASNKLFAKVDAPSEAILDSRVLIATSEAGALKARQLKIDADAFDTDEFLSRLRAFLGAKGTGMGAATQQQKKRRRRKGQESDDEDSELDELDDNEASTVGAAGFKWGKVGKVLAGESRRVPAMDFMYGPLQLEVKEKKARTQRAKNKDTAEQTRPEELQAEDVAKNENETGKVTAKIAKILQEVAGDGIPYLKFVVNPDSFSQTVENMFYFSFLMRENKAAIELEENVESEWCGDMVTFPVDAETASEQTAKGSSATKIQVVLELTEDVWRDAIDAYDITESIIPTREAFVPPTQKGKFKW